MGKPPWAYPGRGPSPYVSQMIIGLKRALTFALSWRGMIPRGTQEELEIQRGDKSVPANLYRPDPPPPSAPGWVVLHGVTRPGRHHPTLLRFANTLASTGAAVLVPEIPEWRELLLAPDEAAATIRASVLRLSGTTGVVPDRIGIMGFSLGVPQVLLAARDPALEGRLRGVAGFGGYGDLDRTIDFLFRGEHEWKGESYTADPDPYGRWIVGGNYLTLIPEYADAGDVSEALLTLARRAGDLQVGAWAKCYDSVKEELRETIHPDRRALFSAFAPTSGTASPDEASARLVPALAEAARRATPYSEPMSFLDQISVPVRLVHGRGDRLIPFSESLRLAEAFPREMDVRVYLTNLFAHSQQDASGRAGGGFGEQLRFLRMLSDLLTLV